MQTIQASKDYWITIGPNAAQNGTYIIMVCDTDGEQNQIVVYKAHLLHLVLDSIKILDEFGDNTT